MAMLNNTVMEQEQVQDAFTLDELPEGCLSKILERTNPRDVCRLSVLNHTLKSAGNSDSVWENFIPSQYHRLLERVCTPLQFSSKKELYFRLCSPVSIDNGTKKFWLDQATGKICFLLSARDLAITWGSDNRYWHWISLDNSSFQEIAELVAVCWFEVQGQFDCKLLSPGIAYTVSFRLKLHAASNNNRRRLGLRNLGRIVHHFTGNELTYGWGSQPVKFSITTSCGHHQESARFLKSTVRPVGEGYQMTSLRYVEEGWMEFDAGEFVVEENEDSPKEVKFCMNEWRGGNWKGGLLLEGVKIQPSFLVTERNNVG